MRPFILFLLDWLRQRLDPDYAADLAAYQGQRKKQQELIEAVSQGLRLELDQLVQLQTQREDLEAQIEATKAEVAELERRREAIRDEAKQKLDALDNTSADALRSAAL